MVCHSLLQWTIFCLNFGNYLVSYLPLSLVVFFFFFLIVFLVLSFGTNSRVFLFCFTFSVSMDFCESFTYSVLKVCSCVGEDLCSLHVPSGFGGKAGSDMSMMSCLPPGVGSSHYGGRWDQRHRAQSQRQV